ncbi:MAG: hypothetical protein ABJB74_14645 [Gemmatimonas sp.]
MSGNAGSAGVLVLATTALSAFVESLVRDAAEQATQSAAEPATINEYVRNFCYG